MSYIRVGLGELGTFGKSKAVSAPTPEAPPDTSATITPEEEMAILEATLPSPEPEPSFIRRNSMPLLVGGGVLALGVLGLILMVKV